VRGQNGDFNAPDELLMSVQELQKRHVMRVLEHVGGNKSQAAEILGISRATIYQMLADAKVGKAS
jgi:DNA-binding NtrC family response regulator